jgi:drug/metabolite transporter (DMT)-like permease
MYHIMPPQMAMLAVVTMVFEPVFPGQPGSIFAYPWTFEAAACVAATALFALLLNLSGLWVLGVFSPVTYSVVGYGKTASVLATGILVFGDEFTMPIFFGILLVFGGAMWYNKAT